MSQGAGQDDTDAGGFDAKPLEDPAKALVAGDLQGAAAGLVNAAATAAPAHEARIHLLIQASRE